MSAMRSMSETFAEDDPSLSTECRAIFYGYSGIPDDKIVAHIRAVRDKAWQHFQYPCIGTYMFLDFGIGETLVYDDALQRLRDGQNLLDLGCCVGQDIRKLVHDGAPASNITGAELKHEFIDLGYELFQDKATLQSEIKTVDLLAHGEDGLQDDSYDMIYAGSFYHLYDWEGQVTTLSSTVQLLKQKPGSMIFGRQTGGINGEERLHPASVNGKTFLQSEESWKKLVILVSEKTSVNLRTNVKAVPHHVWPASEGWRKLLFAVYIE